MTTEGIAYVHSCLTALNIPFEYMEWTSVPVPDTYWVTEYLETENMNEDGLQESTCIITGITKSKYLELETVKEQIRQYFSNEGITAILSSGGGIAVCYSDCQPIPSVDEGVHRLQINLKVYEWRC